VADWNAVERLIAAVGPNLAAEAKRLQQLMRESRRRLAPLEDPFDLDLGLHRWLAGDREEAYSDWLEWVVSQAKTPDRVFKLFNLEPEHLPSSHHFHVTREHCVPQGHIGQEGRLDLLVRYGDQAIIAVEVKTGDAEDADTEKREGYGRWLEEQSNPFKFAVLVAVSGQKDTYEGGFTFLPWAHVCIETRRLARDFCMERRPMTAAMVLAFASAVEQNLVGFSADFVQHICNGTAPLFNPKIVDYMERVVERLES
jgi:hypothetical protein